MSSSSDHMPPPLENHFTVASGSTWGERLFLNLISYSLVLVPIVAVVLATRYRLCPGPLQSSALVQWFVFGNNSTGRHELQHPDSENLLTRVDSIKRTHDDTRNDSNRHNYLKLIYCCIGLQSSYLVWGFLQEKIMTSRYELTNSSEMNNLFIKPATNETIKHSETSDLLIGDNLRKNSNISSTTNVITFHDSQFLVFLNRIIAFILSIIALLYNRPQRSQYYQGGGTIIYQPHRLSGTTKPSAPLYEYVYCSLSNILSSWCQYEALKYVNFPTQVLSKSCKIIAVMLMSKIMLRKRYLKLDYLCAFLLSIGMFVFMLNQPLDRESTTLATDPKTSHDLFDSPTTQTHVPQAKHGQPVLGGIPRLTTLRHHFQTSSLTSGMFILALYLVFDSFTSNWQQSLFDRYEISKWQMMAATNFYSIMLTLTSLHQLGLLKPNFDLLASSSALLRDCLLMSIMSSVGQLFVYYTIKEFGPVVFTLIMTLRQFLAILLSCTIFGHRLTLGSIGGLLIVFLVVGFQIWHKQRRKRTASKQASPINFSKTEAIQFKAFDRR